MGRGQKHRGFCAIITIDIRNAFNSVRWGVNMDALKSKKISGYLLGIVGSYLSDKTLIYETDLGRRAHRIATGVSQGSVLGPLLWNVMYDGEPSLNWSC